MTDLQLLGKSNPNLIRKSKMTPTMSGQVVKLHSAFEMCYAPVMREEMLLSQIISDTAEVLCSDGEIRKIDLAHIVVEV